MSNCTTGPKTYIEYDDEFKVFDALPKAYRKALNESRFKWSAQQLKAAKGPRGIDYRNVKQFLDEQDEALYRNTRNIWPAGHPGLSR